MWTVPSVRVAANGLPRGLHVSASGAVLYPTERVSRWENHRLKIRNSYLLWIISVPSEGMICFATSRLKLRLKLRLHSSSCSTWQVITEIFGELAWQCMTYVTKFHWHIDPSIWLSFFASFRSSQTIILDGTFSPGVIFQQISMKHNSLSQEMLAPRYFPNPPESGKLC